MSRPLSFLLAAAVAVGSSAIGAAPAVAGQQAVEGPQGAIQLIGGRRDRDWNDGRDWSYDRDRRWRHRHYRHRRHEPGFSFSFGVPFPQVYVAPRRDCYRTWDGRVYCSVY